MPKYHPTTVFPPDQVDEETRTTETAEVPEGYSGYDSGEVFYIEDGEGTCTDPTFDPPVTVP